ncbi:hypothetical protein [Halobacillus litoralis]|uniref:hypothetical protein n=1 Tax=Halobacillus litoralis TaxID=45668 RepID=UPI0013E8C199|nr:hypothetical protein [Halobacillus litoralis]
MTKPNDTGLNVNNDTIASSGTNIDEVKRRNAQSGLSYNQVKEHLAKIVHNEEKQN